MSFTNFHVILISVLFGTLVVIAQKLDECQVKDALVAGNLSGNISDWLCVIDADTHYDYTTIKYYAPLGPRFGLFQFQSPTWCKAPGQNAPKEKNNKCKIDCTKFLDSDLTDDIECAKKIYDQFGFFYWSIWYEKCNPPKKIYGAQCP